MHVVGVIASLKAGFFGGVVENASGTYGDGQLSPNGFQVCMVRCLFANGLTRPIEVNAQVCRFGDK